MVLEMLNDVQGIISIKSYKRVIILFQVYPYIISKSVLSHYNIIQVLYHSNYISKRVLYRYNIIPGVSVY